MDENFWMVSAFIHFIYLNTPRKLHCLLPTGRRNGQLSPTLQPERPAKEKETRRYKWSCQHDADHTHTHSEPHLIKQLFLFSLQLCKPPFPRCSLTGDPGLERQYVFLGFGQSFMECSRTVRATWDGCDPFAFRAWQIKSNKVIVALLRRALMRSKADLH